MFDAVDFLVFILEMYSLQYCKDILTNQIYLVQHEGKT